VNVKIEFQSFLQQLEVQTVLYCSFADAMFLAQSQFELLSYSKFGLFRLDLGRKKG